MSRLLKGITILLSVAIASDQIPAPPQTHPILLTNATIHPVTAKVIKRGDILFEEGVITAIGRRLGNLPDNTETIDLVGRHVYPGLIAATTTMGLMEIGAVRATLDYSETGTVNPNVRAEVSYNPDSELIPVTRSNGIAIIHTTPMGGLISGTSAAMMLDGWTWESATLKAPTAMHLNWPRMTGGAYPYFMQSEEELKKQREERLKTLERVFNEAKGYLEASDAYKRGDGPAIDTDLRWETMIPVLRREVSIFVHADEVQQIEAAVDWSRRIGVDITIVGGDDAWRVADLLARYKIAVIYDGVHSLPSRRWEDYDVQFTAPLRLYRAGVKFCIATSTSQFAAPHQRNVPYQAATAAAYGLPRDEALKAVTLYAAEILGIDDRVGSLETGKDATLIITDGDPLDIRTQVVQMFVQGKKIDMRDKHKVLYEKYQEKYRQLGRIE